MRFFFVGPRILGVRPGISLGPQDFQTLKRKASADTSASVTGGFVYVISDGSGRHKIGSSRDPIQRIAQLQTGSAQALDFAYIGVAPEGAYTSIERAAHNLLQAQRIPEGGDEWFQVPASIAIGAVIEAANRNHLPIQQVQPIQVPQIIALAKMEDPKSPEAKAARQHQLWWGVFAGTPWYIRWPGTIIMCIFGGMFGIAIAFLLNAMVHAG